MYASPLPDIVLPDTDVFSLVLGDLGPDAALPAITEVDTGRTVTYGELAAWASRIEATPGEVVTLREPNSIAFAAGLLGLLRSGATVALIGPFLLDDEASHLSALSHSTRTLTLPEIESAAPAAIGAAAAPTPATGAATGAAPVIDPQDLAVIPFSSGTTGLPKAVELTHAAVTANAAQFGAALRASGTGECQLARGTRTFAPLPFTHIYGLNTLLLSSLAARHHVHTTRRFSLEQMVAAQREYAIEVSFIAPPIARMLAKTEFDPHAFDKNRFMVCGAAPLDEQLARTVEKRLGTTILQGYGTTESAPVTHVGIAGKSNPGSIGFAVPNTEYAFSEDGELLVRGPQLMRGYRGHEPLTPGDWLHTGDLAKPNPDGTVTIVDRIKDVFKYRGFQIAPAELEALLITHPHIKDAAVAGRKDPDGEERPWGFVVGDGTSISEKMLLEWVAERVAPYKKLRGVTFVDEIPRNAAGKILRRTLPDVGR